MSTDDMERRFTGVWIPAAIWLDSSLSITEKVMLVEINILQHRERGCFASNEYFSKFFDLSKSRVSEIISRLVARDFVRVVLIREGKQIVGRQIWMTESGKLTVAGVAPHQTPSSENAHTPLRKTRIPPSENKATPFGKGDDPSSENTIDRNIDSNNKGDNKDIGLQDLPAPDKSGAPEEEISPSTQVWEAYNTAYYNRYGTETIRDALANKSISRLIACVGKKEAPHIAAFYVSINKQFYISRYHDLETLVKDAKGIRTQWVTGRVMTNTRAAQLDSTATNVDAAREAIEMLRRRNKNASV